MLQPRCSRCSGELVFANGAAPPGTASQHLLPRLLALALGLPCAEVLLQTGVAGQDGA